MAGSAAAGLDKALEHLLCSGKLGVVVLDGKRRVEERFGALAAWIPNDCDACEAMPFLVGYEDILDLLAAGEEVEFELPNLGMIGARTEAEVISIQAFSRKQPPGVVVCLHDSTGIAYLEQRVLQQRNELALTGRALRQATLEAEASSRAKSTFLANISHELRTPLNVIIGNAEILESSGKDRLSAEETGEFVRDIHENGLYLLDLINDLLDLSKIEAGRMDLTEEAVPVKEVIDEALQLSRALPFARLSNFMQQSDAGDPFVYADRRMIKQMLLNLLSNAAKFSPQGGDIRVNSFIADNDLRIEVRDRGIGIAEAELARLKEPFVQLTTTGSGGKGTGLGLHLVKTMMELHGGELEIQSRPGQGTTVTLCFPADRLLGQVPRKG